MSKVVMQQALDALERYSPLKVDHEWYTKHHAAIKAIKAELAKPEPKPTAWMHHISDNDDREHYVLDFEPAHGMAVYGGDTPLYRREDL